MLRTRLKVSQWLLIPWFVWGGIAIFGPFFGGDASRLLDSFQVCSFSWEQGMPINGLNVIEFLPNWSRRGVRVLKWLLLYRENKQMYNIFNFNNGNGRYQGSRNLPWATVLHIEILLILYLAALVFRILPYDDESASLLLGNLTHWLMLDLRRGLTIWHMVWNLSDCSSDCCTAWVSGWLLSSWSDCCTGV